MKHTFEHLNFTR